MFLYGFSVLISIFETVFVFIPLEPIGYESHDYFTARDKSLIIHFDSHFTFLNMPDYSFNYCETFLNRYFRKKLQLPDQNPLQMKFQLKLAKPSIAKNWMTEFSTERMKLPKTNHFIIQFFTIMQFIWLSICFSQSFSSRIRLH